MAVNPESTLAAVAAIIALGFLGYLLFERTRITDVLILIAFGILIGPVFKVFDVEGFKSASALVGTLALIVIMFDGGLGLNLLELLGGIARSTVLALAGFAFTVLGIAAVAHYLMGLDWITAALLGSILGGTSSVIVIPMVSRTSAHPSTRVVLSVESALTDVLCVIGAVTFIAIATRSTSAGVGAEEVSGAAQGIASQFSIAIVLGLAAGFAWLRILKALKASKYSYMITLAAILFLYAGSQGLNGNGAIAVLIFGVVLGNGHALLSKFNLEGLEFSDQQRHFQGEITFLVRAFFFVYLGVILDPALFTDPTLLLYAAAILGASILARGAATLLATWREPILASDRSLIALLLPRGLAAAVLAGLPAEAGIPGTQSFISVTFLVIVATNLVGTGAVLGYEIRAQRLLAKVVTLEPTERASETAAERPR